MKKIFPLLLLAVLAVAAWFFSSAKTTDTASVAPTISPANPSSDGVREGMINDINRLESGQAGEAPSVDGDEVETDALFNADGETKPAAQFYENAADALKAIQAGSREYDDMILEQFTLPGEDCTWCPELYKSVKDLLADQALASDQRSYYAEILAISGRVDNLAVLVDGIKNAPAKEIADTYSEALELTMGKDDVVEFLREHLDASNESLREASVAAVTNQGSRLAAEALYKNTVERGDPDGYYSVGIGLAELVPNEETLPYLQELALKRDQYSHLAVKALINGGQPGLQIVFDILNNSKDGEADKKLLQEAIDHVNYDEETEAFLKKTVETSKQPVAVEFAKSILEDFTANAADEAELADEELVVEDEPTPMMSSME
ncbi:MAG: hypothetical protein RL417_1794 [Pseudomonadota bacterium]|jgi:hypothetical protein